MSRGSRCPSTPRQARNSPEMSKFLDIWNGPHLWMHRYKPIRSKRVRMSLRETTWWLVAWCIESHNIYIYIYTHGISILNISVRLNSIPFYPVQSIQASIKLPYLIWSNLIQLYHVLPLLSFPFLSFSYLLSPSFTFSNPIYSPIIYPPIHLSIHQPIKSVSQSL
jgi:hypothetical protein